MLVEHFSSFTLQLPALPCHPNLSIYGSSIGSYCILKTLPATPLLNCYLKNKCRANPTRKQVLHSIAVTLSSGNCKSPFFASKLSADLGRILQISAWHDPKLCYPPLLLLTTDLLTYPSVFLCSIDLYQKYKIVLKCFQMSTY